jgi:hypothetical protein
MRVFKPHLSDDAVNRYRMFQIILGGKRMMRPRLRSGAERDQYRCENYGKSSFHTTSGLIQDSTRIS